MNRTKRQASEASQGFTLIELLLGLGIFSIISLSLYATFANGLRLSREAKSYENIYREARWTMDILSEDLENMVTYQFSKADEQAPQGAFYGKDGQISLLVATDDGLKRVRYYLESPEDSQVHKIIIGESTSKNKRIVLQDESDVRLYLFIREESPFFGDAQIENAPSVEQEIISRHVQEGSLKFRYAFTGEEGSAGTYEWLDQWNQSYNPIGVRVEMAFLDEEAQEAFNVQRDILIPTGSWGKQEQ